MRTNIDTRGRNNYFEKEAKTARLVTRARPRSPPEEPGEASKARYDDQTAHRILTFNGGPHLELSSYIARFVRLKTWCKNDFSSAYTTPLAHCHTCIIFV